MDMGYFLHRGSGIQSMDGCAVDQMEHGTELVPDASDISYFHHYDEQIGAISPELTFMPQSLNPTMQQDPPSIQEEQEMMVSVSTVFYPGANDLESDICFSSSDRVLFYVHSQIIRAACEEAFSSVLSGLPSSDAHHTIFIDMEAAVLNVILHTLYGTSSALHSPSLETLTTAVGCMPFYNINPKKFIQPGFPLYTILLAYAPLYPIDIYSLAAQFDLKQLAVNSSSHLLSYPLSSITDEMAQRMGAIYLKRLMCLHYGRNTALRDILLVPPHPHPETKNCSFADQKGLTRAWALVSAYLAWEARSDLSTSDIQKALNPLTEQLTCEKCHQTMQKRIRDAVVEWTSVKRTI